MRKAAVIISSLFVSPAFAQNAVEQHGSCNQANSGSGNNTLKCYFYLAPRPQARSRSSKEAGSEKQRPSFSFSSPNCEPDQETTVRRPAPVIGDPGSGVRDGVLVNPGDSLKVRFQLGNRCYFNYCSPFTRVCVNASVDVHALMDKGFLDKAKSIYEICKANIDQDKIIKCMEAHGLKRPH